MDADGGDANVAGSSTSRATPPQTATGDKKKSPPIGVTGIRLMRNGKDVTNKTIQVDAGEQVVLTAKVRANLQLTDGGHWSVGDAGKPIGGFTIGESGGPIALDLSSRTITLYWTSSGTGSVAFQGTKAGATPRPVSATVNFSIYKPSVALHPQIAKVTKDVVGTAGQVKFGLLSNGVTQAYVVPAPSDFDLPQRTFSWCQIVNPVHTVAGGKPLMDVTSPELDRSFPYLDGQSFGDSPSLTCPSNQDATYSFRACLYLMWKSATPGAIFVPIASTGWGFDATWSASTQAVSGTASISAGGELPTEPTWHATARGGIQYVQP